MSEENVEKIKAMLGPFDGVDISRIDWESDAIREILERAYSPEVELRTLESAIGSGQAAFTRDGTASSSTSRSGSSLSANTACGGSTMSKPESGFSFP